MNEKQKEKLIGILVNAAAYPESFEQYNFEQIFGEKWQSYKSICYLNQIGHLLKADPEKPIQEIYIEKSDKDPGYRGCTDGSRDQALASKKYELALIEYVAREIFKTPIEEQ